MIRQNSNEIKAMHLKRVKMDGEDAKRGQIFGFEELENFYARQNLSCLDLHSSDGFVVSSKFYIDVQM